MQRRLLNYFKKSDQILWGIILMITAYGLLLLRTVPTEEGRRLSYFAVQLLAAVTGYFFALLLSLIDYRQLAHFWYVVAALCLFLILLTQLKGQTVTGADGVAAKAWISLPGGLTFQPSELVKIGFLITFGNHLFVLKEKGLLTSPLHVILLAAHAMIPVMLVHLQHDDGTAIIFFCMFLFMSFGAGIQLRYFAILAGLVIIAFPIAWTSVLDVYQRKRFLIFLHPETDPLGYGLQQLRGKISIGSGGFFGKGLFEAPRVNSGLVPIQQSDFVFSVAGESLGFVGCMAVIVLLALLLTRILKDAGYSTDLLGSSICMGYFGMIFSQMIFNLGMCLNLFPVMGVTLPFFSAGGSSSSCLYLGIGLVQSVVIHRRSSDRLLYTPAN